MYTSRIINLVSDIVFVLILVIQGVALLYLLVGSLIKNLIVRK